MRFSFQQRASIFIGAGLSLFLMAGAAHAADLFFSPASGTYSVGQNISVGIYVSSADQAMNAASSTVVFPSSVLQVVSLSKTDSIFSFWAHDPSYSNASGTVNFEGVVFDPGYTGSHGKLLTVIFKVRSAGTAALQFTHSSVLANDGNATEIFETGHGASFALAQNQTPSASPVPSQNTLTISQIPSQDPTDPVAVFALNASDAAAVDHYDVQIDNGTAQSWQDDGSHEYHTSALDPGSHVITARAWYKDNTVATASAHFSIIPLPTPIITDFPATVTSGQSLTVKGTALPSVKILLFVQRADGTPVQVAGQSGPDGVFALTSDRLLQEGSYTFWVQAVDSRGAKSNPTAKAFFAVRQPLLVQTGSLLITILSIAVPLLLLLIALILLLMWGHHRLRMTRHRLKRELSATEAVIHKAFDHLKDVMEKQVRLLDDVKLDRSLTNAEDKIIQNLKRELDKAEQFIEKGMQKTERKIR